MTDIVAIGEPMIEFNQTVPGEPQYLQGFGGDTSNCAIAAARQGARVGYVTRLGDDAFGRMFLSCGGAKASTSPASGSIPRAYTAAYFVTHDEPATSSVSCAPGSAASADDRPRPAAGVDPGRRVFLPHVSGISQAISGTARPRGVRGAPKRPAWRVWPCPYDSNLRLSMADRARTRGDLRDHRASDVSVPASTTRRRCPGNATRK